MLASFLGLDSMPSHVLSFITDSLLNPHNQKLSLMEFRDLVSCCVEIEDPKSIYIQKSIPLPFFSPVTPLNLLLFVRIKIS